MRQFERKKLPLTRNRVFMRQPEKSDDMTEIDQISDRSRLKEQINAYLSAYPKEQNRLVPLRDHINQSFDIFDRTVMPGHVTASGIVIEKCKILMIFHPTLKKWLQPGGHVEGLESPFQAAKREVMEETNILPRNHFWQEKNAIPIDIDIHVIPANQRKGESAHLHYDFRYLFTPDKIIDSPSCGLHRYAWRMPSEIDEPHLQQLIAKLRDTGILSQPAQ